ncbi:MAG: ROK family protein, partial [bacterium]
MENIYLGIDVGGTAIKAGAVTPEGIIREKQTISTEVDQGVDHVIGRIADVIKKLSAALSSNTTIAGIGLGMPGQINTERGILLNSPNLPAFKNIDVPARLTSYFNLPIVWDNDANLAALGEFTYGAGKEVSEMMLITLGTGIGSGLILRGKIYHGCKGYGGEFGHLTINPEGPPCNCGSKGCVEAYAGTQGILRTFREITQAGTESILHETNDNELTPKDISDAAQKGDTAARETFNQVGFYLGVGLAGVVNLLNLEMIVVGGGIAKAGDLILEPVRKSCKQYALIDPGKIIKIVPSQLGNAAGLVGAAHL